MITMLGWTTTLYFIVRRWVRQRQAWQWWHDQQVLQLHDQAESIRDDLLQQTFAFRRYLENTLTDQPDTMQAASWLDRCHSFHQSLEQLSNELSPPFMADSLPLALQYRTKLWQHSHPDLTVNLDLPARWPDHSPTNNHSILFISTQLVEQMLLTKDSRQLLHLALESQADQYKLTLKLEGVNYAKTRQLIHMREVKHLKEIFHSLAAGHLAIKYEKPWLIGQLCWSDIQ